MTTRGLPEGRYGSSRRQSRWGGAAGTAMALLVGLGVAVVGYRNVADPSIEGQRLGFTLRDGSSVEIRFEVTRKDPSRPGVCLVRARSLDGDETGRKEVYVPPAEGRVVLSPVIHTSRPPVTGDVYGCSMQVPAYLRPSGATVPGGAGGG